MQQRFTSRLIHFVQPAGVHVRRAAAAPAADALPQLFYRVGVAAPRVVVNLPRLWIVGIRRPRICRPARIVPHFVNPESGVRSVRNAAPRRLPALSTQVQREDYGDYHRPESRKCPRAHRKERLNSSAQPTVPGEKRGKRVSSVLQLEPNWLRSVWAFRGQKAIQTKQSKTKQGTNQS